ncbi:organelle RRM domain-containing protein 2, mitochondrial-like isoform X2 [Citrus sinensis]|uniref:organelle RRM domain-containing protein 2, mitochondrial-like isoform X2 n=1 Tax=Citrus sinensis TaxID=2711 RepID=UPI0022784717|nr:organelle RRM domain-containing protein 2, mitochondrial-like isoform X2 [Citrus sinensis]
MAAQSLIQTRKIQQFNSYFTEDSLLSFSSKAYLSQPLKRSTIIMDIGKNRSKGYGYVTSSTEEEAQKALVDMNGKLLDGRVIFVDNVRPSRRYNTDASLARQPAQSPEEN